MMTSLTSADHVSLSQLCGKPPPNAGCSGKVRPPDLPSMGPA